MLNNEILTLPFLDTLAQLPPDCKSTSYVGKSTLYKRARAKFITNCFVLKLVDTAKECNGKLLQSYWNTYHCAETLVQDGKKLTSKYCNCRWCLVCNRIRTAKLINGYSEPLSKLKDLQFVTLTVVNPTATNLKSCIENMTKNFRLIQKSIQKKNGGTGLVGIRKFECTYNSKDDTYHPHFHLLISGLEAAEELKEYWLIQNPTSKRHPQDIKPANENSVKELFKYFTKLLPSKKDKEQKVISTKALNIIFEAIEGKRVFQPFGIKKVTVSEDIEKIESLEYDFLEDEFCQWLFNMEISDWEKEGNITKQLTNYSPSKNVFELLEKIK